MPRIPKKNRIPKNDSTAKKIRQICIACNGSGHYDNNGAPPCSSCDGTGWEPGTEMYRRAMLLIGE